MCDFQITRVFKQVGKIIFWPRRKLVTEKVRCVHRQILKFKLPEIPYSHASHIGASNFFWQRAQNLLCFGWWAASLKITTCKPDIITLLTHTHTHTHTYIYIYIHTYTYNQKNWPRATGILRVVKKLIFSRYCVWSVQLILVTDVIFKYFEIKRWRKYVNKGECK